MIRLIVLLALISCFSSSVFAVVIKDGETQAVHISLNEINRLRIKDARIENVRGPANQVVIETDEERGEIYLRAVNEKTFSLFVSGDNGETYTLLLIPKKIPAANIVLNPASGASALPLVDIKNTADPFLLRIKKLARVMSSDSSLFHNVKINHDVIKTKALEITKVKIWPSTPGHLKGEQFVVKNYSNEPVLIRENEFKNLVGMSNVVALAVKKHFLEPQENTDVFVIFKEVKR